MKSRTIFRPFYGYHKSEHQFLRIQLYNPNLLRRMSNLLQSGMILGKQFQPHESHIPYILKFFIDYNLFGMSYLHIPLQCVQTRSDDNTRYKKRSVSQLEVDFKAIYILNRLAAEQEQVSTKAANPGIESIWEDERQRRFVMDSELVPPMESAVTQRKECPATESDIFFRTILRDKITQKSNESVMSQTMSNETLNESPVFKKKFNLKNLLDSSVYAAEYSQSSFTSKSSQYSEVKSSLPSQNDSIASQTIEELENQFLDYSESTDVETMNDEDFFDLIEEYPDNDFESDSLLAPLSQFPGGKTDINESTLVVQEALCEVNKCDEVSLDSEDEMYHELNVTVANMEMFSQYEEVFPQLDGVDDELRKLSPSEITQRNDKKKNLYPQPGPSHLYKSPIQWPLKQEKPSPLSNILNNPDVQNNLKDLVNNFKASPASPKLKLSQSSDEEFGYDDDHISSFYNKTMMEDDFMSSDEDVKVKDKLTMQSNDTLVITSAEEPPDPKNIFNQLNNYNIPQCVHPSPFYSNPKDVTGKKEVGHNILDVPGKRLFDLEDFKSVLVERYQVKPIEKFSKSKLVDNMLAVYPNNNPPSYKDAINWLKSTSNDREEIKHECESPIKEKLERTLMVLKIDDEMTEDLDKTLVPTTPTTPDTVPSSQEKLPVSLSQYVEEKLYLSARRKRNRTRSSFSKRFQEIMKAKAVASIDSDADNSLPDLQNVIKTEQMSGDIFKTSQSSDSSATKSSDQNLSIIVQNANVQEDLSFNHSSDITGPSLNNTYGFKMKLESLQSNNEHTDLTILSMELHVNTRGDLKPNPEFDAIKAIFYCLDGYCSGKEMNNLSGIIVCIDKPSISYIKQGVQILLVKTEMEILEEFLRKVREFDPDIFAGYEIETASWGYLIQRGYFFNLNLNNALSRMPTEKAEKAVIDEEDQQDVGDYYSEQRITGRILLDVWRLMKHEIALTSYTFENVCYHVLHRR